jgi:hypothetical protein
LRQSKTFGNATRAKPVIKYSTEKNWLTYVHGGLLAVFNFAEQPQRVPRPGGEWQLVIASETTAGTEAGALALVAARATRIYQSRAKNGG